MALTAEEVVVKLRAELSDYDRKITNSTRLSEQAFGRIGNASERTAVNLKRNSAGMSTALKGLAATLAASFTGRELIALGDSFTRIQNNLRVAGVEGEALRQVQERLRASAAQYGVELEGLTSLFGSLTQASKELGASQSQIFGITDAVSASLKITGLSAQQASGALLQLGQALRGGKVQAEEYNSLLDGLYPLLEAAANGSERFGGSVAKLTTAVKDGSVTSKEFFSAILSGSNILEQRAAKATLTTGAAFATLRNELTLYFGEASKSSGATAALAEAIGLLADNLDTVIPAIAVISTALGVGFVTNAGRAALAAKGAGAAMLGAFGGPVGIAITAITVALVGLANETARTRGALERVDDIANDAAKALDDAAGKAESAATGVKGVGSEAATSERKVRSFAGAVGEAAQKLYDLARARQQALISDLEARRKEASLQFSDLSQKTDANIKRNLNTPGQGIGTFFSAVGARTQRVLGIGPSEKEVQEKLTTLRDAMADYDEAIRAAATNLERFAKPDGASQPGSTTGTGGKAKTAKSPLDPRAAAREQDALDVQLLSLKADLAKTAEERAGIELQRIDAERAAYLRELASDKTLTEADRARRAATYELVTALQKAQVVQTRDAEISDRELEAKQGNARYEQDALAAQARSARTRTARLDAELRLLDAIEKQEREELDAAIAAGKIADAAKARADLAAAQADRRGDTRTDLASPLERYADRLSNTEDRIESFVVDELQSVQDGIAGALSKAIGTKDPLIASLISLFIEQVIMRPIAQALANASGGGGGIGGAIGLGLSAVLGLAGGGSFQIGGRGGTDRNTLSLNGRPIANVSRGETINVSNTPLGRGGSQPQAVTIIVQANDYFDAKVASISQSVASPIAAQEGQRAYTQAVRDTPIAMSRRQRFGS